MVLVDDTDGDEQHSENNLEKKVWEFFDEMMVLVIKVKVLKLKSILMVILTLRFQQQSLFQE